MSQRKTGGTATHSGRGRNSWRARLLAMFSAFMVMCGMVMLGNPIPAQAATTVQGFGPG
ncbi:MAG: hypothetical protein FWG08_01805 [Propionibacteriaceae bacterium]|nr:hypothetical protein [Propionibacteriaceae bacterium]